MVIHINNIKLSFIASYTKRMSFICCTDVRYFRALHIYFFGTRSWLPRINIDTPPPQLFKEEAPLLFLNSNVSENDDDETRRLLRFRLGLYSVVRLEYIIMIISWDKALHDIFSVLLQCMVIIYKLGGSSGFWKPCIAVTTAQ